MTDSTNRLSVKSTVSLFDDIGDEHRIKLQQGASWRHRLNALPAGCSGRAKVGLVDFVADPTMALQSAASNATYYAATTHSTSTGHVLLAGIAAMTINALW